MHIINLIVFVYIFHSKNDALVEARCSDTFSDTDIPGNNLTSKLCSLADCMTFCQSTSGCKAYAWTGDSGGTCVLKTASSPLVQKQDSYVKIVIQDQFCSQVFNGRDIQGNTMATRPGNANDCCNFCRNTAGCKAYTWDTTSGGTCYLKSVYGPLVPNSNMQCSIMLPGTAENCTLYWDNHDDTEFYSVTQKYYFYIPYVSDFAFANEYCTKIGGNVVAIHSKAENDIVTTFCQQYNVNVYIGGYRYYPQYSPQGFVWTDGTSFDYTNWNPYEPDNWLNNEYCVQLFAPQYSGCSNVAQSGPGGVVGMGGNTTELVTYGGKWNDILCSGSPCGIYASVCQVQCGSSEFPIDGSCPFTTAQQSQLANYMTKPNFNTDILTIIMAMYPVELKSNISWSIFDLVTWASFERYELNLKEDFVTWYDNSMGNCFTFNHINSSHIYKLRYTGEQGGLKVLAKVHQDQFLEWAYTASLLVFFHTKEKVINGESVSYNVAPGEETTFTLKAKSYTRLGPPYGVCIHNKDEVKSFYGEGVYNVDVCFQSCYQDYVYETCGCMDPRYASKYNITLCGLDDMDCFLNITIVRGEPSTWPECKCPLPCQDTNFEVSWSKTTFRTNPIQCANLNGSAYTNCTSQYQNEIALFSVYIPTNGLYVFAETPTMTFNDVLNSFNNLTGLLLGVSVVSFVELIFLFVNLGNVVFSKKDITQDDTELKK